MATVARRGAPPASEEADDVIQTEGGAQTERDSAPELGLLGKVSQQLFHPALRWGNAKLALHVSLFAGAIWLSQTYGYLLAQ